MNRIVYRPEVETDFDDAVAYILEGGEVAARSFLASYRRKLDQLELHPESAPVVHGEVRRALLPRSPFGLYYVLTEEVIVVLAILDLRQDPTSLAEISSGRLS